MTPRIGIVTSVAVLLLLAAPAPGFAQERLPPNALTDLWHQSTLTGDWGGVRSELANRGVVISGSYTGEVFANVQGGIKRGASYDGVFEPQIDVDLQRLLGWRGASFEVSMLQGHGPDPSQGWVGNLLDVSSTIIAPPATRLFNLWLQQNLFNGVLSIRAGIENADAEFIISPTGSLFVNSTFGWPDGIALVLPGGGPEYPLSAPFVRVKLSPGEHGPYAQIAVFSGDPTGHDGSNDPNAGIPGGTIVSFNGGAFVMGELGYTLNQAKDAKAPLATFRLGGWYHTGNRFQDQRFDNAGVSLASPASDGVPLNHDGDWGIYGLVDATLYHAENGGGTLSAFARFGGSGQGDRNLVTFYGDSGLSYKGLIPSRDNDTAGIAFGLVQIGANARGLDQDIRYFNTNPTFPVRDYEAVLELTYQAQITPWMTLQPDLQRIFHPGGYVLNPDGSIRHNAVVLGLHSVLTF